MIIMCIIGVLGDNADTFGLIYLYFDAFTFVLAYFQHLESVYETKYILPLFLRKSKPIPTDGQWQCSKSNDVHS